MNDFSDLQARLDSIDQSVANINRQIAASTHESSTTPSLTSDSEDVAQLHIQSGPFEDWNNESTSPNKHPSTFGLHQTFDKEGGRRFYGSTAALSLSEISRRSLGAVLGEIPLASNEEAAKQEAISIIGDMVANNPALKSDLQSQYHAFPFQESCVEPNFDGDGRQLACPPRSFLDAVLQSFLDDINIPTPLFRDNVLKDAIKEHYSSVLTDASEPRSVCLNNIILSTLGLKSRLARRGHCQWSGMDDDLLLSFLNNSRRALQKIDSFLVPRLVNAQALTTLVSDCSISEKASSGFAVRTMFD